MFINARGMRGDEGASAVEFALVLPILLTLAFGIVEFAVLMRDHISATSSVRTAARIASSEAGAGPATCTPGPGAPPCSPEGTPKLAQDAADAIQRAGTTMPKDAIEYLWVYEANAAGFPQGILSQEAFDAATESPATAASACTAGNRCVWYRWNDAANRFQYRGGGWRSATINACAGSPDAQAVGVYLRAAHDNVIGYIPYLPDHVADRAVMKFEPLPSGSCNGSGNPGTGGHA